MAPCEWHLEWLLEWLIRMAPTGILPLHDLGNFVELESHLHSLENLRVMDHWLHSLILSRVTARATAASGRASSPVLDRGQAIHSVPDPVWDLGPPFGTGSHYPSECLHFPETTTS